MAANGKILAVGGVPPMAANGEKNSQLQPSYMLCEENPPPMAANGFQWPPMGPDRWCLMVIP
jgi:hypothetical protein